MQTLDKKDVMVVLPVSGKIETRTGVEIFDEVVGCYPCDLWNCPREIDEGRQTHTTGWGASLRRHLDEGGPS